MMRRITGAAHVEDLESIVDPDRRAACEKHVLTLARSLLLNRDKLTGIDEVSELALATRNRDPQF